MAVDEVRYQEIVKELRTTQTTLVAVSKTKAADDIKALYDLGQRDFGENYVQELVSKADRLPKDIRWHFIGHLQSNKVKIIAPFVHLIHVADSLKLLSEINKQAEKHWRHIDCLLQVHIAKEETKFGLDANELDDIISQLKIDAMKNVNVKGLMGMASFTDDQEAVRKEFRHLKTLYDKYSSQHSKTINFSTLSMGMSADYKIAVEEGSNLVRIGSLLFGNRR